MRFLYTLLLALPLVGCTSVDGTIDGLEVDIESALQMQWLVDDTDTGSRHLAMQIVLSSVGTTCGKYAKRFEATDPAEAAEVWAETWPDDWWELRFTWLVDDPESKLKDQQFTGTPWDAHELPVGAVTGQAWRHLGARDAGYWSGTSDPADYGSTYVSDGGTLTIDRAESGEWTEGTLETTFAVPDTGASVGAVSIDLRATRCVRAERLTMPGGMLDQDEE